MSYYFKDDFFFFNNLYIYLKLLHMNELKTNIEQVLLQIFFDDRINALKNYMSYRPMRHNIVI
jgi:hypothetical protein